MERQLQITLPEDTLQLIDQLLETDRSSEQNRSHLIDKAIKFYITQKQQEHLKQQLQEGAVCRAERDLNLARDWFAIEEEV
jgi:CopG family transcriptional regulator/antitoxin EndoAI